MWRDVVLGGVYVPAVLVIFAGSLAAFLLLDALLARTGFYRAVWHPSLFRLATLALLVALVSGSLRF
jgi:hypothetical protein